MTDAGGERKGPPEEAPAAGHDPAGGRAWWAGLAPIEAEVRCSGDVHRLRWEAGELQALDHDQPDSERVLAALSGQPCVCVQHLDTWARHRGDLTVLVLASRGPADHVRTASGAGGPAPGPRGFPVSAPLIARGAAAPRARLLSARAAATASAYGTVRWGNVAGAATTAATASPADRLPDLLGVHPGLSDRLAAGVIATWAARLRAGEPPGPPERAALHAALYGRALASLRAWLGRPDLDADVTMLDEGAGGAARWQGERAELGLSFGWLLDVWVPGLVTLWGRFCLSATPAGERVVLRTVGPDLSDPVDLALDRPPA